MAIKTVGEFSYDTDTDSLSGPAQYMSDRGDARLERIMSGQDVVFNFGVTSSPDIFTAVLVSLQTDYASWKGSRQLLAGLR